MKNLINKCWLLVFVCIVLLASTPVFAKEWSAEQKEVVDWFNKYTEVSIEGNSKEILSYFHAKFSGWDYSQTTHVAPFDKTFAQNFIDDFTKKYQMISFVVEPLEVKVEGDFAIIHVNYNEKFKDSDGNEITMSGPWTSALIKQNGKWLFISWSWLPK